MDTQPIALRKNADRNNAYEVDAISGGTMTSNGVTDMLAKAFDDYSNLNTRNIQNTPNTPTERKETQQ